MPIRLALSLHAPNNALRSKIMPLNDRYPIEEVLGACEYYFSQRRSKIFIEYIMLNGVNDTYAHALELVNLLDRHIYKVNLIPYNMTGSIYSGSTETAIARFKEVLATNGLQTTVRLTRGSDIDAACGQLAARQARAGDRPDHVELVGA